MQRRCFAVTQDSPQSTRSEEGRAEDKQAEQTIAEALRKKASRLFLSGNQLKELPESLGQLTQLQSLDLSSNPLTELQESLCPLVARAEHLFGECSAHYTDSFSARARSSVAPSPRHALPCMHASVVGLVEASFSINALTSFVWEK